MGLKIGIVCSPTYGGSGVVATELGRFLAKRGHQIHFISTAMPFRLASQPTDNVFYHEVQAMNYPVLPGELYGISLASKTIQVASDFGLDIVHAHYAIPHAISAWLAREVACEGTKPFRMVTTLHGTDITLVGRAPSFYPVARFAIERSDAVTTVSNWLKEETLKEFGVDKHIEVIPNFVDENTFSRTPNPKDCPVHQLFAPEDEKILIHISNFREVKRIPDVIRIFDKVRQEMPAKLLMIGDGPERDSAQRLAQQLGIDKDVFFLGKQERIESYFGCADLMLFPSEYESFGLAALEAMAAEVPVIASNGGGLPEVIDHGITSYLADVGDIDTMAHYAIDILKDESRRREMGRNARQSALDRFLPEIVVPHYEKVYEKVLNGEIVGSKLNL